MNDKFLIVVSIIIALGVWLHVYSNENSEGTFELPVNIMEERDGTIAFAEPNEVTIRVTGPQTLILKAMSSNVAIDLNVSDRPVESTVVRISPSDIKIPGVEVVDVTPSRIFLDIRPTVKQELIVRPSILGLPAEGYKVASVVCTPEKVVLEGLKETLNIMKNIQTKNINVASLKETKEFDTQTVDYNGIKNTVRVSVRVVIEEDIITKDIFDTKIVCMEGAEFGSIEAGLPPVDVTLEGRRDILNSLSPSTVFVEADCTAISLQGKSILTARSFENFSVIAVTPDQVDVNGDVE